MVFIQDEIFIQDENAIWHDLLVHWCQQNTFWQLALTKFDRNRAFKLHSKVICHSDQWQSDYGCPTRHHSADIIIEVLIEPECSSDLRPFENRLEIHKHNVPSLDVTSNHCLMSILWQSNAKKLLINFCSRWGTMSIISFQVTATAWILNSLWSIELIYFKYYHRFQYASSTFMK